MSSGLSITRKIKPFVPNCTTSLKNSEEGSLRMENKDLKERLEKRHGAKRLEAIALQDKNKSLMTALQLLNGKLKRKTNTPICIWMNPSGTLSNKTRSGTK